MGSSITIVSVEHRRGKSERFQVRNYKETAHRDMPPKSWQPSLSRCLAAAVHSGLTLVAAPSSVHTRFEAIIPTPPLCPVPFAAMICPRNPVRPTSTRARQLETAHVGEKWHYFVRPHRGARNVLTGALATGELPRQSEVGELERFCRSFGRGPWFLEADGAGTGVT